MLVWPFRIEKHIKVEILTRDQWTNPETFSDNVQAKSRVSLLFGSGIVHEIKMVMTEKNIRIQNHVRMTIFLFESMIMFYAIPILCFKSVEDKFRRFLIREISS